MLEESMVPQPSDLEEVAVEGLDLTLEKDMVLKDKTGRILVPLANIWWRQVQRTHQAGFGSIIEDGTGIVYCFDKSSLMDQDLILKLGDSVKFQANAVDSFAVFVQVWDMGDIT